MSKQTHVNVDNIENKVNQDVLDVLPCIRIIISVVKNKRDCSLCHSKYIEQSTFTRLTNSLDRFKNQFDGKVAKACEYAEDDVQ